VWAVQTPDGALCPLDRDAGFVDEQEALDSAILVGCGWVIWGEGWMT